MHQCPDCKDTGKIELFTSTVPCKCSKPIDIVKPLLSGDFVLDKAFVERNNDLLKKINSSGTSVKAKPNAILEVKDGDGKSVTLELEDFDFKIEPSKDVKGCYITSEPVEVSFEVEWTRNEDYRVERVRIETVRYDARLYLYREIKYVEPSTLFEHLRALGPYDTLTYTTYPNFHFERGCLRVTDAAEPFNMFLECKDGSSVDIQGYGDANGLYRAIVALSEEQISKIKGSSSEG